MASKGTAGSNDIFNILFLLFQVRLLPTLLPAAADC